ncbi:MAG TPA: regulatory protein RecX [Puia sp.]|jgi:regulatory protein
MLRRSSLTPEQALQKARHYCAYQERCHTEVKEKLYSFGLHKKDVEAALSTLIEENYLNEERFAIQFSGGRFRMKQWGRVKIRYELKQKQVGEYCIKKALAAIDEDDYRKTLEKLAARKWATLQKEGEKSYIRRHRLQEYLQQKGYETDLVAGVVREIEKT